MHEAAVAIRPDVRFHPEIPLVALLCLVHSGIAFLFPVLRGGGGIDDGGVGEAMPLLEEVEAQHAFKPDGRASALAVGISGFG